jgi:DNA-binding HxlR family transcriptional regulator
MAKQALKNRAVRGSRSGRPIMALLDLLGRRWSLRILWELREATLTSRALRQACDDASPTVLQARLSDLRQAGFVELLPASGYRLTEIGRELLGSLLPLHKFADRWRGRQLRSIPVIASEAKQSRKPRQGTGLLRRCAPRNDESSR